MSGITSIVRAGIATFRPSAVPPGRLFFTCLWISFLTAAIYVLVAQQHRIADLENQLHTLSSSKDHLESVRLQVAGLMQVGNALTIDLLQTCTGGGSGNCGTLHCRNGLTKSMVLLQEQGHYSDAIAFERAKDKIVPVAGVIDFHWKKEHRKRMLTAHQDALEEISRRLF